MNLRLDPLQVKLTRSVRAALAQENDRWERLAELCAMGLGLPVDMDGLDLGLSAEIIVLLELGRSLEPLPGYRETLLAAQALAETGNRLIGEHMLPQIAAGQCRVATIGLAQDPTLEIDGQGRIWGHSEPLAAASWDAVLIRARDRDGEALVFLSLPNAKCQVQRLGTVAGPAVRLVFEGAEGGTVIKAAQGEVVSDRLRAIARVHQAAFLVGIAEAALIRTRDHVTQRRAFNKQLIELQTIAHRLAILTGEFEGVKMLVHEAAWCCDIGQQPELPAVQSLAAAAELALRASRLCVQLHGARGIIAAGIPARAYRLAAVEALRLGTPSHLWREAGQYRLELAAQHDRQSLYEIGM